MRNYLILLLFLCSYAKANDVKSLAQKSGCLACHSVDKKILGPAFSQVAAKYKDDPNYLSTLVNKVKKGGSGVWGPMPMPSNDHISDENITTIVSWIVTGIQPSREPLPTTTTASSTNSNSSAGKTILKGLAAAVGVYAGVQETKSNSRSRSKQVSQPVPPIETKTSTQTPQNNYPLENQDVNDVSSGQDQTASATRDDETGNDAKNCVQVFRNEKGYPRFRNICNFKIAVSWCVVNDDCRGNPGYNRLSNISPGGYIHAMANPDQDVRYGACDADQFLDTSANDGSYFCKKY